MLQFDRWLLAMLIFRANEFICNNAIADSSNSTSTTNINSNSTETDDPNTTATAISTAGDTSCTTAETITNASTPTGPPPTDFPPTKHNIIAIGSIVVVAVVVLVTACYYRRRSSSCTGTKARKDNRFSDNINSRESVRNTYNPNVRPSLEWDNRMSITVHSDANAVYASVQKMRPSQSETPPTASDIMINTMERVPDNTYNHKEELLDDTYDSTITCGKTTLDETYDHINFKTNYYSTCDTYDNTNVTHDTIYDPDAQQSMKDFEPTYEYTRNNVDEETFDKTFQPPRENVDDIYNNI